MNTRNSRINGNALFSVTGMSRYFQDNAGLEFFTAVRVVVYSSKKYEGTLGILIKLLKETYFDYFLFGRSGADFGAIRT
ncbi:hypothetical protein QZM81_09290 [Burkholderia cepacia]|uniref:hypothetical protein n=1 Tax=Burkholderia cepacia TaxID=292 RepID=UPI00264CFD47|nr:hypothetical protein [Burkholderia cepacia]MDN7856000.1 hypothetical protein [Burkholderia cepacia]